MAMEEGIHVLFLLVSWEIGSRRLPELQGLPLKAKAPCSLQAGKWSERLQEARADHTPCLLQQGCAWGWPVCTLHPPGL